MPRKPRIDVGNMIYHVLNRGNNKATIFENEECYALFKNILIKALKKYNMRILGYCLMPNHWHLILYPRLDRDLSKFMKWLTTTHAYYYRKISNTSGNGHVYQGRYKSFIVDTDAYLIQLYRYIERNPVRAGLVKKSEYWKWSSLSDRKSGLLFEPPTPLPDNYLTWVNEEEPKEFVEDVEKGLRGQTRGSDPFRP